MTTVLGILVLLVLAIWMVASYFRPPLAFVLIVVLYPLKQLQQTYLSFFATNTSSFNFLVGLSVLSGVYGAISRRRTPFAGYNNPFLAVTAVLYIFAVTAILWTPSQQAAIGHLIIGAPYWAMQLILIPLLFPTVKEFGASMKPTLIFASIVAVLFLTSPFGKYNNGRWVLQIGFSSQSDFGNPLASAQMGGQMAFIAALLYPGARSFFWSMVRVGALILGLALAVQAGSRGQLVASVFITVLLYPIARKVKDLKQFMLTSAGFAVIAGVGYFTISILTGDQDVGGRWSLELAGNHLASRSLEASRLLSWWWSEPTSWPFGLGANAFSSIPGAGEGYVHNVLVELLCEYGLFGLGLFGVLCIITFRHGKELFRRHADDPSARGVVAILIAIALYSFFLALKQGALLQVPEPYYFWLLIVRINCAERLAIASYQAQLDEHEAYHASAYPGAHPGYEDVAAAYSQSGNS